MELGITFYNVENLFDIHDDPEVMDSEFTPTGELLWDDDKYQRKLLNIAEVLLATGSNGRPPAFIGLAEVENRTVIDDLVHQKGLSDVSWGIAHADSRDVRGIDVAFVYNKNFFTLKRCETLNFEERTGTEFGARDILHVSGILNDKAQSEFHFFINHWPSRQGNAEDNEFKRLAAAQVLREKAREVHAANPDAYLVMMGDFNDSPKSKSLNSILKAGEHNNPDSLLINLGWKHLKKGKGTVHHDGEWYVFDNIVVSPNLLDNTTPYIKRREMYIYDDNQVLFYESRSKKGKPHRTYVGRKYKGGYSDHLAVYCRLAIESASD